MKMVFMKANYLLYSKTKAFCQIDSFIKLIGLTSIRLHTVQSYKLQEVGVLTNKKAEQNYETGQIFLHKVFGYRGVILFPWIARVLDRSETIQINTNKEKPQPNNNKTSDAKPKPETYYQVLIDNRDIPYIRAQVESVTFLGNQENNRSLYSVPGLDYVSHNDIIPYISTEKKPIVHELFDKFLLSDSESDSKYSARENLRTWQERNHPWLELSDVVIDVTNNVKVTVIPFYMGSRESQSINHYWWRYSIRIENLGSEPITLRERHWRIFSIAGTLETVRGKGVVGLEPCLNKDYPVFQYSSHVSIQAATGHMWGTFKMEKQDGTTFEVRIPPFNLESYREDNKPSKN